MCVYVYIKGEDLRLFGLPIKKLVAGGYASYYIRRDAGSSSVNFKFSII